MIGQPDRSRRVTVWLVILLAFANLVAAQTSSLNARPSEIVNDEGISPLALGVEGATQAYLEKLSDEQRAKSDAYFEGGYWLQLFGFLYGLAVAWIWLGFRWSARLRDWAEARTGIRFASDILFVVGFLVVDFALTFPLTVYQRYFREHQYGLATQSLGPWLRDQLVGLGVGTLLGALAFSLLYVAIRKTGDRWWIWGTVGGVVFLCFVTLIAPVFIAPLFNTYEPLQDETVRAPILDMANANGIPVSEVYQFDASRQSSRISANVSGFLNTMRISLNDNLLERCSLSEVRAVMAHEMGHYVLNHVYEGILFFGLLLLCGFGFLNGTLSWTLTRFGDRFGIHSLADVASLPLLGALLSIFFFVMTPVTNTYIRTNEAEADIFGLNAAGEPDGFAEVSLKLAEYRKIAPSPWEEFLFFDHPSGRSRIAMAMQWKESQERRSEKAAAKTGHSERTGNTMPTTP